jgi:hypothetical protein
MLLSCSMLLGPGGADHDPPWARIIKKYQSTMPLLARR